MTLAEFVSKLLSDPDLQAELKQAPLPTLKRHGVSADEIDALQQGDLDRLDDPLTDDQLEQLRALARPKAVASPWPWPAPAPPDEDAS